MDKNQKTYVYIGGAVVGAYLVYRVYQARSGGSVSGAAVPANAATSSDFASLSGQEQADVAALQSDFSTLQGTVLQNAGTEVSDVQALTSDFTTASVTEQGDVTTLQAGQSALAQDIASGLASLAAQLATLATPTPSPAAGPSDVPAVASGDTPTHRSQTPWTSGGFFNLTLGQVVSQFRSPEATARYLFAKGYRPTAAGSRGPVIEGNEARAGGRGFNYGTGGVFAGTTWQYTGGGAGPLPRHSYTIGAHG